MIFPRLYQPLAAAFMAAFLFLAGCATMKENDAVVQLVLDQAVLRAIEGSDDPRRRAERIVEIATDTETYIAGNDQASVSIVLELVKSRIDWGRLSIADQSLVNRILLIAEQEIVKRISDGDLDGADVVYVGQVVGYIKSSAEFWLSQNPE